MMLLTTYKIGSRCTICSREELKFCEFAKPETANLLWGLLSPAMEAYLGCDAEIISARRSRDKEYYRLSADGGRHEWDGRILRIKQ